MDEIEKMNDEMKAGKRECRNDWINERMDYGRKKGKQKKANEEWFSKREGKCLKKKRVSKSWMKKERKIVRSDGKEKENAKNVWTM